MVNANNFLNEIIKYSRKNNNLESYYRGLAFANSFDAAYAVHVYLNPKKIRKKS